MTVIQTRRRTLADLLGDGGLFIDGDWVESKDQDPAGDVRLIQLADVGDGVYIDKSARFLTSQKARELKCTLLQRGDILIARMPDPLGRACLFPGDDRPCVTVVDVCIVRPSASTDRRWLLHAINSPTFRRQVERHIKGTTRQRISRINLGTIELDVPPLPEQRRIADILDKADAIRRKRKKAIALTEELLRSAFLEMFGDPVTNPKGWPRASVEDLCSHVVDCPHTTPTYEGAFRSHPCVRTSDLQGGFFDWSTTKYVSEEEYRARITRLRPEPGDVCYTREGERYGIAAILPTNVAACLGQRMMLLRPNRAVATPEFLWASMNSVAVYRQATAEVGGSTSPHVNVRAVRRFSVLRPPIDKQRRYSQLCERAMRVRVAQLASCEEADTLFSALVSRLFGRQEAAGAVR